MKNPTLYSFLYLILLVGITSCDKSKLDKYIPRVEIEEVIVREKSVMVKAKVNNPENHKITSYGLRWRTDNFFIQKIDFYEDFTSGIFTYEINYALESGEEYKVSAVLFRPEQEIISKEKVFTPRGSLPPEIEKVSRFSGAPGDTIHVEGRGFPKISVQGDYSFYQFTRTKLKIGDNRARIIYVSENKISAIIPYYINGNNIMEMLLETPGHETILGNFEYITLNGK